MAKWICKGVEFKVGDKVKVVRSCKRHDRDGMGDGVEWLNSWVDEMNTIIGKEVIIKSIEREGVRFISVEGVDIECSYPLKSLDKISPIILPGGNFSLLGRDGVEYSVGRLRCSNLIKYLFFAKVPASIYMFNKDIVAAIEEGYWSLQKSQETVDKEERLEAVEAELQTLITEKNKLEMELAI